MRATRAERRLRTAQSLYLVGALLVSLLTAVVLVLVGVPQPIATAIALVLYLVCWRVVLRVVRRRRGAAKDADDRQESG